ncbi:TLP18.3, Psb32 and MOLO-1 founding protein of phosphatase [Muriicola jejuensis]|uniref:TPM domain-containing protein n=1 Tax=Muriicola jejuensis TaxID=504488 RepID=A0A6P0UEM5_9FLAO|nr:TPM domain-containing protein [Muriicola jejuensis]NER11714.1 TPM domain-containing protein [Muriicola jejuensis]SMP25238.1 TLP18.3, Psb32 and MOLO-1 founding protein of phosphatase [Muriicola jejuensis]
MAESKVEAFLTPEEEQEIVEAIRKAEKNTSGEIRVHIEPTTKKDHYERAREVFQELEMNKTRHANGVLLYIAVLDRTFVIYGDQGINEVVPETFWNDTKEVIQGHFKQGRFKQGIVEGILKAGEELKEHFPYRSDDKNELSNEVSKG